MIGSFALVGRNPYLSSQQKIVQARVYAQGLTLGVLCASAAFEISDRRRGRGIMDASKKAKAANKVEDIEPIPKHTDSNDQGDLWKDMVAAEEQRLKNKHQTLSLKSEQHAAEKKKKNQDSHESKAEEKSEGAEETKKEDQEEKPKEESEAEQTKADAKDEKKAEAKDEKA